ncbi:MAG TPA: hypothetical protein VJH04_04145 [archaeon]|nr:hypothetical protein [archaeon]
MEKKFIAATLVLIFFVLLGVGSVLSERCIDIAGCKQCWKTTVTVIESELCGENSTCLAQPEDVQNNAIADAVVCACDKAKSSSYEDTGLNANIEDVVKEFAGYDISASQVCEQPGQFFVKRAYT